MSMKYKQCHAHRSLNKNVHTDLHTCMGMDSGTGVGTCCGVGCASWRYRSLGSSHVVDLLK